jgi:predicted PurR-regulated permease PerM
VNFGSWIGFVAFFISLFVLWQIRQLLLLIFTAIVIATSLNILVKKFCRMGLKRGYGVALAILLLAGVVLLFFQLVVPPFVSQFQQLAALVPLAIERLSDWLDILSSNLDPDLIAYLPDTAEITEQIQPLIEQFLGGGLNFFYSSLGTLLSSLLLLALSLMLLADPTSYRLAFMRLFPAFYRRRVDRILVLCDRSLRGWLVGIIFNMSLITILSFIGLLILRIPLALAQAVLAGALSFIPNIGPTLSVLPPIAIALLSDPWKAIAILILYVIVQQLESNILTPLIMSQRVSLLPAITLLSQIFFATFFGFLGLLIALPLTIVGQVWVEEVLIKDILDRW